MSCSKESYVTRFALSLWIDITCKIWLPDSATSPTWSKAASDKIKCECTQKDDRRLLIVVRQVQVFNACTMGAIFRKTLRRCTVVVVIKLFLLVSEASGRESSPVYDSLSSTVCSTFAVGATNCVGSSLAIRMARQVMKNWMNEDGARWCNHSREKLAMGIGHSVIQMPRMFSAARSAVWVIAIDQLAKCFEMSLRAAN